MSPDDVADPIAFLQHADVEIEGRMPWSSNATFLTTLRCGHAADDIDGADSNATIEQQAIYKPVRGERPLWDFEPGLHRRERAVYLLSEHLGIGLVPPTVIRDGPLGEGSFQWFVPPTTASTTSRSTSSDPTSTTDCREMAVLDVLGNNTDRKSGHCLLQPGPDGDRSRDRGRSTTVCASARRTRCGR